MTRLMENDIRYLPDDLLEHHRSTMSPCLGIRGEIIATEEYVSAEGCAKTVLRSLAR